MKKIIVIIFCLLCASYSILAINDRERVSTDVNYDIIEEVIGRDVRNGDQRMVDSVCNAISLVDTAARDHYREVQLLHAALDSMNLDIIVHLNKHGIGDYDASSDSITPLSYFMDEKCKDRIRVGLKNNSPKDIMLMTEVLLMITMKFEPPKEVNEENLHKKISTLINIIQEASENNIIE